MYLSSFFLVLLLLPPSLLTDVQIRLVGPGSTLCSGRVEVYHNNSWGTVCDDDWDLSDAQVVCRQMDCGAAVKATDYALFGQGSGKIWLDDMHCSGYEDSLTQCQGADIGSHNCGHSEDAGVVCSASLPKPYVTVTPSEVNCSITTEFTEGKFILKNSNQDLQTSADNPATFNLPQVTFYNEGPYYCLYQIKVSGQFINSPQSDPIMLHVTVPLLFVASTAAAGGLLLFLLMLLLVCLLHKRRRPRSEWTPRAQVSDPAPNQQEGDIYAVPQSGYSDDYEVLNVSKNHVKPNEACLTEENGEEDDPCNDDDEDNAYENVQQTSLFVECGPK